MAPGPAFLRRFPKLLWRPPPPQHIVKPEVQELHPEMGGDFTILSEELMDSFRTADNAALRQQNTFYLVQIGFAVGAVLATVLGAVGGALGTGHPYIAL